MIQQSIEDELSEAFLRGDVREGDWVEFDYADGRMTFNVREQGEDGEQAEKELPAVLN